MNAIQIGRKRLSDIVWGIIDEKVDDFPYERIEKIIEEQQPLREQADYKTGSVPYDDAVELYKVVRFFQPKVIAEVGTFIGVSTMVMDLATPDVAVIYTCDVSNNIDLNMIKNVVQYPKTMSSQMFEDMRMRGAVPDLVYLDGRLGKDDIDALSKIIYADTVFVFDDFEGIEKGVINAMMIEAPNRVLIYPREGNKTAMSIPFTLLQIVPQEAV